MDFTVMVRILVLLLILPSLVLAQSNAQFAPPILPMYQPSQGTTIYNGPGNSWSQAPAIIPMGNQGAWNLGGFNQGWNQNGWNQGWNQAGWNQGWNQPS